MKLYYFKGACSLAPHIMLEEIGLPYELERVDLKAKVTASGADFMKINPKGYVPALQLDSGDVLTEVQVIVQYLADLKPELKLAPAAGTLARYQLQSWLSFISAEVHKAYGPLFNPAASADSRAAASEVLKRRLGYLDAELATRPWVTGAEFTAADAYLVNVLLWLGFVKMDLQTWPHLADFYARATARPAVNAAMKQEGFA